ncbi:MAG: hypothetical protein KDJ36_07340 [Hyphomicrobiaceae bacterium]|nr:hypothetical protein [Hyphomicrobiaceae bacterium]
MATTVAIEVEGTIDVAERALPADMPQPARASARSRKIQDVLIVLERDKTAIEQLLVARAKTLMTTDATPPPNVERPTPRVEVAFPPEAPAFSATVYQTGSEGRAMSKQVGNAFAAAVREEFLAHVARRATNAGHWEVVVNAAPKRAVRQKSETATSYVGVWLSLIALFAAAAGGAYYYLSSL